MCRLTQVARLPRRVFDALVTKARQTLHLLYFLSRISPRSPRISLLALSSTSTSPLSPVPLSSLSLLRVSPLSRLSSLPPLSLLSPIPSQLSPLSVPSFDFNFSYFCQLFSLYIMEAVEQFDGTHTRCRSALARLKECRKVGAIFLHISRHVIRRTLNPRFLC